MTRENDNILRMKEVRRRVGLDRSTIYRKEAAGTFPARISLSTAPDGRVTASGWYESDVNAWLADPTGWRPSAGA